MIGGRGGNLAISGGRTRVSWLSFQFGHICSYMAIFDHMAMYGPITMYIHIWLNIYGHIAEYPYGHMALIWVYTETE